MLVSVDFGNSVSGAWIHTPKGEVAMYSDKKATAIVLGYYDFSKEKNAMPAALVFNKNGEVILQKCTNGEYTFQELDPLKVAEKIKQFLSLEDCLKE